MKWNEMEWHGMTWNEMEWNGLKWTEMEWNGMNVWMFWPEVGVYEIGKKVGFPDPGAIYQAPAEFWRQQEADS